MKSIKFPLSIHERHDEAIQKYDKNTKTQEKYREDKAKQAADKMLLKCKQSREI